MNKGGSHTISIVVIRLVYFSLGMIVTLSFRVGSETVYLKPNTESWIYSNKKKLKLILCVVDGEWRGNNFEGFRRYFPTYFSCSNDCQIYTCNLFFYEIFFRCKYFKRFLIVWIALNCKPNGTSKKGVSFLNIFNQLKIKGKK